MGDRPARPGIGEALTRREKDVEGKTIRIKIERDDEKRERTKRIDALSFSFQGLE